MNKSKTLTINGISFKMIYVEGGTFNYSLPANDTSGAVTDYWILETPVTRELFRTVINLESNIVPSSYCSDLENAFRIWGSASETCPASNINWYAVDYFIKKLNEYFDIEFMLPTLGLWNYAAQGGKYTNKYIYAGSNDLNEVGRYWGNGLSLASVKSYKPNELGLYDMSGNVWEWCRDGASLSYLDNGIDTEIPSGPGISESSVYIKGGSYTSSLESKHCELNYTSFYDRDSLSYDLGFRLVCKNLVPDEVQEEPEEPEITSDVPPRTKFKLVLRGIRNGKIVSSLIYNDEVAVSKYKSLIGNTLPEESQYNVKYNTEVVTFNRTHAIGNYTNDLLWEHNLLNNWCNWYNEQHPFEFEFVVADNPHVHKMFNNLKMIANKTLPESFHYEVVGEVYDFKNDKSNMYYRLESSKRLYNENGCNISYDEDYDKIVPHRNPKSAIFPLTVSRVDRRNKLYDVYLRMTSKSRDYQAMSGSEIVFNRTTNDFNVATHIKAYPLDGFEWTPFVYDDDVNRETLKNYYKSHGIQIRHNDATECWEKKVEYGRRLGNCKYQEDIWDIQVPAINYVEKNEDWINEPPINIALTPVPEDLMAKGKLTGVPTSVETDYLGDPKQTRIRDKYIKIKVRYDGSDLAIISAIITQYKESYN